MYRYLTPNTPLIPPQDIYRYLKESELKHMPKWNYMTKQTDINHNMRSDFALFS